MRNAARLPKPSREAAKECSPGRKPWVKPDCDTKPRRGERNRPQVLPPLKGLLDNARRRSRFSPPPASDGGSTGIIIVHLLLPVSFPPSEFPATISAKLLKYLCLKTA